MVRCSENGNGMGISALSSVTVSGIALPQASDAGNTGETATSSRTTLRFGRLPMTKNEVETKDAAIDLDWAEESTAATRSAATDAYDVVSLKVSISPDYLKTVRITSSEEATTTHALLETDVVPEQAIAGKVAIATVTAPADGSSETTNTTVAETISDYDTTTVTYTTTTAPAASGDLAEAGDDDHRLGVPSFTAGDDDSATLKGDAVTAMNVVAALSHATVADITITPDVHAGGDPTAAMAELAGDNRGLSVAGGFDQSVIRRPPVTRHREDDEIIRLRPSQIKHEDTAGEEGKAEPKRKADDTREPERDENEQTTPLERFRMAVLESLRHPEPREAGRNADFRL